MRILPVVGLLLLGTAGAVAAQQPKTQQFEATGVSQLNPVDDTTQATNLKYKKDAYDRMTVPVRVSGYGPYRFLIDTGADRTAISADLARQLRLHDAGDATLHSVTGASAVGTATVPVLDLTAKQVNNVDAAVLDSQHMGADGILGLDSLSSQRILFDFRKQTLRIVPSDSYVREDPDTIVVTARVRNGRLILSEARAEGTIVTLVIDTGAQVSIGNEALRRKLTKGNVKRNGIVELQSVTGEKLAGEYTIVRELSVGGVTLKKLPIVFADSHAFKRLGLDKKPALLLGMNALRSFDRVSIDFARKKLKVVLPEESGIHGAVLAAR